MKFLMVAIYFGFVVSSVVSSCAADIVSKLTDKVFRFEQSAQGVRKEISFALRTIALKPKGRVLLELIGKLFDAYAAIHPGSKALIGIGDKLEFFPTRPDDSPVVGSQLLEKVDAQKSRINMGISCTNKVLDQHRQQLLDLHGEFLDKCKDVLRKDTIERLSNLKVFLIDVHLAIIQACNDLKNAKNLSKPQEDLLSRIGTLIDEIKKKNKSR